MQNVKLYHVTKSALYTNGPRPNPSSFAILRKRKTPLRLNCPPCSKADIGQTIQGINCLSGSQRPISYVNLHSPRRQFFRPVLRCGHRVVWAQSFILRLSGLGSSSRFERPWSSRRHNCYDLGRLVFETTERSRRTVENCDFRPHPHRSPPQSQRPKASAMDANYMVIHGGNLILDS